VQGFPYLGVAEAASSRRQAARRATSVSRIRSVLGDNGAAPRFVSARAGTQASASGMQGLTRRLHRLRVIVVGKHLGARNHVPRYCNRCGTLLCELSFQSIE